MTLITFTFFGRASQNTSTRVGSTASLLVSRLVCQWDAIVAQPEGKIIAAQRKNCDVKRAVLRQSKTTCRKEKTPLLCHSLL